MRREVIIFTHPRIGKLQGTPDSGWVLADFGDIMVRTSKLVHSRHDLFSLLV